MSRPAPDAATRASDPAPAGPWWETLAAGTRLLVAVLEIRSLDWSQASAAMQTRRRAFLAGLDYLARELDAALLDPTAGDRHTLVLSEPLSAQSDAPAPAAATRTLGQRAFRAARLVCEHVLTAVGVSVRVAVHADSIVWPGSLTGWRDTVLDATKALAQHTPERAIALSEALYLDLPEDERALFACQATEAATGGPAHVSPRSAIREAVMTGDLALWHAFRRYAASPDVRLLRYVGFRLRRQEPPCLDVRDVFVSPWAQWRVMHNLNKSLHAIQTIVVERKLAQRARPRARETRVSMAPPIEALPWSSVPVSGPASDWKSLWDGTRSLVLLGDPGAGKTTLLRWLAVTAAAGPIAMARAGLAAEHLVPLPVSVGRLAEVRRGLGANVSVTSALAHYFHERSIGASIEAVEAFLRARLEAGQVLLLLDGLDEVRSDERLPVERWLEAFAAQHPRGRTVVTARLVGYSGFVLPEVREHVLHPFADDQVERYVRGFHRAYLRWESGQDDRLLAEEQSASLLATLRAQPRLAALARNPFLLSALALMHRAEGRLPRHRVQVYEVFAQALCETWAAARRLVPGATQKDLSYEGEALPVLGALALHLHSEWPTGAAPTAVVVRVLTDALRQRRSLSDADAEAAAREFLTRAGREAQILYERGPGFWSFLHLTFQEFFVAAGLHHEGTFERVALRHLFEPRWREVLRLGVGYMALVQHRGVEAARFVERVSRSRLAGGRAWLTDVLRLQVPLAALLATELGDALSQETRARLFAAVAEWTANGSVNTQQTLLADLAATDQRAELRDAVLAHLRASANVDDAMMLVRPAAEFGASAAEVLSSWSKGDAAGPKAPLADAFLYVVLVNLKAFAGSPSLGEAQLRQYARAPLRSIRAAASFWLIHEALTIDEEAARLLADFDTFAWTIYDVFVALYEPRSGGMPERAALAAKRAGHQPMFGPASLDDALAKSLAKLPPSDSLILAHLAEFYTGSLVTAQGQRALFQALDALRGRYEMPADFDVAAFIARVSRAPTARAGRGAASGVGRRETRSAGPATGHARRPSGSRPRARRRAGGRG